MRTIAMALGLVAACGAPASQATSSPTVTNEPAQPATSPAVATSPSTTGDETTLTSRRWKYASFFNALKRTISNQWDPTSVWSALPANDRAAYGFANRNTEVLIAVAPDGSLQQVSIKTPSGVKTLDDEALRAVTDAAPFNKPPADIPMPFAFTFYFEVGTGAKNTSEAP